VGSTVGLGTPIFALVGSVVAWNRMLPKNKFVQALSACFIGGAGGTLFFGGLVPFLSNHSEVVLPFSIANGLCAAAWYTVLDYSLGISVVLGSPEILSGAAAVETFSSLGALGAPLLRISQFCVRWGVPLGGPAVGLLTAASAGYMYPIVAHIVWPAELKKIFGPSMDTSNPLSYSFSYFLDLHHFFFIPVSLPVALMSGFGIHKILSPVC